MLFSNDLSIVIFGSLGIASLMFAALFTDLRINNSYLQNAALHESNAN